MKSEIQMNSKEEDSGSDRVQPSGAAQRASYAGQVVGSPTPVHAPGAALFSPLCLQVAGKEPHEEGQAVPKGQGTQQGSCRSLEGTCGLSQHVTMQKITDKGTQARPSKQMQSPHSLWPPCSVQKRKDRSGAGHHSANTTFPFEPSLLPSCHVNPAPKALTTGKEEQKDLTHTLANIN